MDHDSGSVVWAAEGKSSATLKEFFEALGPERRKELKLVTMDMSAAYQKAVREAIPHAEIVFDRFHLARLAHEALKAVQRELREALNRHTKVHGREATKGLRWILLMRPERLNAAQEQRLSALAKINKPLYRAYLLKEAFLDLFHSGTGKEARDGLDRWLAWASRSRLSPFVKLARTVRRHRDGILRAFELPFSNALLEGTNNKIRLLSQRAYDFHSAAALIAMIYLCCSAIN